MLQTMNKSKKQRGKKSVVQEVVQLDPNTSVVTLSLFLERPKALSSSSWDAVTKSVTASTHLCGDAHVAVLFDLLNQCDSAAVAVPAPAATTATTQSGDGAVDDGCVLEIPLVRRPVNVKHVPDMLAIANGCAGKPHRVELYVTSSSGAAKPPEGETAEGGGATTSLSPKARKPQKAKPAKKGQPTHNTAPLVPEDRVAVAWFNGCDLLTESQVRVPLVMNGAEGGIEGVSACWLQLSTGESPLIDSDGAVRSLRPVSFTVHSLENVPSIPAGARQAAAAPRSTSATAGATAEGGDESLSRLHLCVEWGTHRFRVPVTTGPLSASLEESFCRSVFFLRDMSPFEAYRQVFHEPIQVTLVYTDLSLSQLPMGSGCLPVRGLVTDDQTFFSEAVQLLPQRSTFSAGESCLTAGTTVNMSVDFALPLPPVTHVTDAGVTCPHRQFLTRAVLVMPYSAPWCETVLGTLIEKMKQLPRATDDVHAYVEPVEVAADDASLPPSVVSEAAGVAAAAGGKEKDKSDRGSRRGRPSRPNTPPPPVEVPSPYLSDEIKVVSPCGVSGFEISDGTLRVLCVEATVPEVHALVEEAAAASNYAANVTVLLNSELFVPQRLYLTFPPLVTPPECFVAKQALAQSPGDPSASTSQTPTQTDAGEGRGGTYEIAEAGGTGGRIHRVRLGQSLDDLMQQQKYLLKRTLSASCLSAFQCLYQLVHCETFMEAMDRALFPSAADVISLERSFGRTLDLFDIFGRSEYDAADASPNAHPTASVAASSGSTVRGTARASPTATGTLGYQLDEAADVLGVDLACVQRKDVGHLAAFTGSLLLGRKRPVPEAVVQRFQKALWMTTDDGVDVLCVFPRRSASGTIRYHVEGQVVACGDSFVLYVLDFQTLAKSWTDTHNATYEAFLKSRTRREKSGASFGTRGTRFTTPAGLAKSHAGGGGGGVGGVGSTRRGNGTTLNSSDDDDALSPPTAEGSHASSAAWSDRTRVVPGVMGDPKLTRTARLRAEKNAEAAQPVVDDETLWQLYNARAPANTTAATSSTLADGKQRPVMRF